VVAKRDPVWTADGRVFEAWAPISPVSGRLDAFEWRVVAEAPTPRSLAAADDALAGGAENAGSGNSGRSSLPVPIASPRLNETSRPPSTLATAPEDGVSIVPDDPGPPSPPRPGRPVF
jgi:HemY protein